MTRPNSPKATRRKFVAAVASVGIGGCGRSAKPLTTRERAPEGESVSALLKPIALVRSAGQKHWVGDGFHVSTIFSPRQLDAQVLSPFILMDHAAPRHFPGAAKPRGVREHPHRGFETVTFAYQGEVDHRDSHGGGGTIGAGDVQWMTAASGVVHEEMQSKRFTQAGGVFEMVQLWVNLPARLKMTTPRYQELKGQTFPRLEFGKASGRLIAGTLQGKSGPAKTHSPITLFDMDLPKGSSASFELPVGRTILVFVLGGQVVSQSARSLKSGDLAVLDRSKPGGVQLSAKANARVLVLSGEPLGEPVVAQGPFVMNTRAEIAQAMQDYRDGRMGTLAPTT